MDEEGAPDLTDLCAELAGELDEVTGTSDGDAAVYVRGGVVFARVSGSALEVRLPADIAEAAARTTDTFPMDESGWIRFAPTTAERHVTDRAEAWFVTAWRHAESG